MIINILIPMAGRGGRLDEYNVPKPLIDIDGKPMIQLVVESLGIPGQYIFVKRYYEKKSSWNKSLDAVLKTIRNSPIIYEIDEVTEGPACSAMVAKSVIDNDTPLIITNCDQIMKWNVSKFVKHLEECTDDGLVVTYGAQTKKNSYIRLDENGYGIEIREKEIISNHSLNGIHYWARGSDFVASATEMIRRDIRVNGEFYIGPTYNILIKEGKKISIYQIADNEHFAVGVPADIERFLNACSEAR